MNQSSSDFPDEYDDLLKNVAGMSDSDLERLMSGDLLSGGSDATGKTLGVEDLAPGTRIEGQVVDVRSEEILVELDGKNLGVIDLAEFGFNDVPEPGAKIQAEFVRYDRDKEISILSTERVKTEIFWDDLSVGTAIAGTVIGTNKGGLTLDIKGERAFLPISQIERERVEDLNPYVGKKLQCEVTQIDRGAKNLVVSRRVILDREAEEVRKEALTTIDRGDVRTGTVTRITDHGAFIDIGGVDGLLHANKIRQNLKSTSDGSPLSQGQRITVEVTSIDLERGRVGLDFHQLEEDSWDQLIEAYSEDDVVTGWVSKSTAAGTVLKIDEGLEALIPREYLEGMTTQPAAGSIVRVRVTSIDHDQRQILVEPV